MGFPSPIRLYSRLSRQCRQIAMFLLPLLLLLLTMMMPQFIDIPNWSAVVVVVSGLRYTTSCIIEFRARNNRSSDNFTVVGTG